MPLNSSVNESMKSYIHFIFSFLNLLTFIGTFELLIYASVNISKRMEGLVKDDKGEISDADILTFQDWTSDIVRIPDT